MRNIKNRLIALLLIVAYCLSVLSGCSSTSGDQSSTVIFDEVIHDETINPELITPEYIASNLIYDDGIYEVVIGDELICDVYIIETVISDTSVDEIKLQLPEDISDYDINWPKVIGQFAVGTSVIIAVGVVNHITKGATYFVFGSPAEIAAEALIGGALDTVIQLVFNSDEDNPAHQKVKKLAIEGFAEGYMIGALSAVAANIVLPKSLKLANGAGKYKISNSGDVTNKAGEVIGKALYSTADDQIQIVDKAGKVLGFFKSNGDQIVDITKAALKPNEAFWYGTGEQAIRYFTDADGKIFRIGDDLVKNGSYVINGYKYYTDDMGRIVKVVFDDLHAKPTGRDRLQIKETIGRIGKGYEKTGVDDRGHLIADMFDGDNTMANIVPMDSKRINQGAYLEMEQYWAECLEQGKKVSGEITLTYPSGSFRPSDIEVSYLIDGIESILKFIN